MPVTLNIVGGLGVGEGVTSWKLVKKGWQKIFLRKGGGRPRMEGTSRNGC